MNVSRINYGHLFRYDQPEDISGARGLDMIFALQKRLKALLQQKEAMHNELVTATTIRDRHLEEQAAFKEDNGRLRQQMDEIVQIIDEKQALIDTLKQTVEQGKQDAEQSQKAAAAEKKNSETLQTKVNEYRQQIEQAQTRAEQARAQTEALKSSLVHLERRQAYETATQKDVIALLHETRSTIESTIELLQQKGREIQLHHIQRQEILQSAQNIQQKASEAESQAWKDEVCALTEHLKSLNKEDEELAGSVENCKNQVESLVKRVRLHQTEIQ
ncbi:uncharacterized protein BYT42DRAFT_564488 [Radiomyces spectabilis]|uniref:uncharacterized protein n=1 Tax=Radiomyces spectabilis TaxID=64574 RepID=UPI00221F6CA9|nr:uncharacterized protein BYT42DRAFT_564488 [Radiomyces spectabilis]KAI8385042.1 hypothetical protein BYT42DRAFT_564488 [Radiomyces spectabilis]